jgi:hypothetical protein
MATLLDVRTDFVKMSMRYDLITGGAYSSDNGADAIINDAQKELDRGVLSPRTQRRFTKQLLVGDYFFTMEDFISLDSITIKDTSDTDSELNDITKNGLSYESFRSQFNGAISSWSSGEPSSWAPAPLLWAPEFTFPEQLTNGTFTVGSGWTLTGNWALDGGTLNGTTDSGNVTQDAGLVVGRTYRITYTITKVSAGSVAILCGTGTTGTSRSTAGTFTEDLVCATDTTFGFDGTGFTGSIDNVSAVDITLQPNFIEGAPMDIGDTLTELPASTNSAVTGIILNPPCDAEYVVEVLGKFYTRALSADTDTSYWTVNYPTHLAVQSAWLAEMRFGSQNRADYWQGVLDNLLKKVDMEVLQFEMSGMSLELDD